MTLHQPILRRSSAFVPRRVLVVDDSAAQRRVLALQLTRWGYQVTEAGSGDQAEDQATEIATMLTTGFPVAIKPSDDHKAHISVLFAFNQAAQQRQQAVDQSAVQVLMDHLQQHLAALEKIDPNTSRAIQKQLRDTAQAQMKQQEQVAQQQMQPQPQVI